MKLSDIRHEKTTKLSPLFRLERKLNYKALIVFSLIASVLLFINIALFPYMDNILNGLLKYFDGDQSIKEILEVLGNMSIGTYFSGQAAQVWAFIGGLYAAGLGCKLINNNFKDGSYELLYTQNASRTKIVLNKLLRLVINLVIFNTVCALFGLIALLIWGNGQFKFINFLGYYLFTIVATIQIGVFSFALALLGKRKFNIIYAMLIVLVFYTFASLTLSGTLLKLFQCLSPLSVTFTDIVGSGYGVINYYSFAIWFVVPAVLLYLGIKNYKNSDLI